MRRKIKEILQILRTPEAVYFQTLPPEFSDEVSFLLNPLGEEIINYSMNISLLNRFVFVETPKVACSSIKTSLQKLELGDHSIVGSEHTTHKRALSPLLCPSQIHRLKEFLGRKDLFKFCFVRNPYTRLLSAYLDKIMTPCGEKRSLLKQMGRKRSNPEQFVSFEDFVTAVGKLSPHDKDPHWREQHHQLMYSRINYDFVGYFEDLDLDLKRVLERIKPGGADYFSKTAYHQTGASNKPGEYFTQKILEQVNAIYTRDFETFGYPIFDQLPKSAEDWEAGLKSIKAPLPAGKDAL